MPILKESLDIVINPQNAITSITALSGSLNGLYKTAAGVAAAFAGIAIVDKTWRSMKTAETSIIKLKTALQDSVKGVQDYERAVKFAAETPFPVEKVVEASVALRTFQADPFEIVTKSGNNLINVLGDMAGAMGQDLTTATLAFTRALQGEWEIMDNNFQINSRSIPKLKGLTAGTKEYRDELIKFISTQKRFIGGMDAMAQSMGGMLSNLADAVDLIFMGIGGVADSEARLKGLTLFDSVKDSIRSLYEAVSSPSAFEAFEKNLGLLDKKAAGLDLQGLTNEINMMGQSLRGLMIDPVKNKKAITDIQKSLEILETRKKLMSSKSGQTSALFKAITPGKKDGGARNADETVNFLLAQTRSATEQRAIIDQFLSQGDKLMQLGRIIGQFFKLVFDGTIKPIIESGASVIESLLNKGQDILSLIVPVNAFGKSVLDTFRITNAEIESSTDKTSSHVEGVLYGVSQNVHDILKANMGNMFVMEKEFMDLGSIYVQTTSARDRDAIEMRFLSAKSTMEKMIIVFAILMNIIGVVIKNRIAKIFDYFSGLAPYFERTMNLIKMGFFSLVRSLLVAASSFWSGFSRHIYSIREAFGELMVTIGTIFARNSSFIESLVNGFSLVFAAVGWVIGALITFGLNVLSVAAYVHNFMSFAVPILKFFGGLILVTVGATYLWKTALILLGSAGSQSMKLLRSGAAAVLNVYRHIRRTILLIATEERRNQAIARATIGLTHLKTLAEKAYTFAVQQGAKALSRAALPILAITLAIAAAMYIWEEYGDSIIATLKVVGDMFIELYDYVYNLGERFGVWNFMLKVILVALTPIWLAIGAIVIAVGLVIAAWEVFKGAVYALAEPFNLILEILDEMFGEIDGNAGAVDGIAESSIALKDIWEAILFVFDLIKPIFFAIGEVVMGVIIKNIMFLLRLIQAIVYGVKYGWGGAMIALKASMVDILVLAQKFLNAFGGKFTFADEAKKAIESQKAALGIGQKLNEKTLIGRTQDKKSGGRKVADNDTKEYAPVTMPIVKSPEEKFASDLKYEDAFKKSNFNVGKADVSALGPGIDKKSFEIAQKKQFTIAEKSLNLDVHNYRNWTELSSRIEENTRPLRDLGKKNSEGRVAFAGGVDALGGFTTPISVQKKAIGEWNVPKDMTAYIHKDEMIIPAAEASAIRELFDKKGSGQISGSGVFDKLSKGSQTTSNAKTVNINIKQDFYGRQAPTAGSQMKSVARELATELAIQGD